ncbi:protein of unknown function [Nitrospira defluvii]|uniref:Uncharacterized protein n=1 Tax=Nitrospira defluvii TaxID=330214 RepID=D8P7X6_9BACT|nr:protein of unknown function [Nitrospira defluvii]
MGAFRGGNKERPEEPGSCLTEAGHTTTFFNHSRGRARDYKGGRPTYEVFSAVKTQAHQS